MTRQAERLDVAAFDAAMLALKLMSAGKAGQPIAKRFAGARRLLIIQAAMLLLQVAAAIGARRSRSIGPGGSYPRARLRSERASASGGEDAAAIGYS